MQRSVKKASQAHGDVVTAISDGLEPDMMCEVFILAPTPLIDDHEIAKRDSLPSEVDVPGGGASEPQTAGIIGQRVCSYPWRRA